MAGYQYDIFENNEIDQNSEIDQDSQLSLPINPLQYRLGCEIIQITDRELEILQMTLTGRSINEIALKVFLSTYGVKFRLSSIYAKFNCINRLELIKLASTTGLQFESESGIKHSFFLSLNIKEHNDTTTNT